MSVTSDNVTAEEARQGLPVFAAAEPKINGRPMRPLVQKYVHENMVHMMAPDEQVLRVIRKHWFYYLRKFLKITFIALSSLVATGLITLACMWIEKKTLGTNYALPIGVGLGVFEILVIHLLLARKHIVDYIYDLLVITNKSVAYLDKSYHLIGRDNVRPYTVKISSVVHINIHQLNFWARNLGFGLIEFQTRPGAGSREISDDRSVKVNPDEVYFKSCPHVNEVQGYIIKLQKDLLDQRYKSAIDD